MRQTDITEIGTDDPQFAAPDLITCPACNGTSADERNPECETCDNTGRIGNPEHPDYR